MEYENVYGRRSAIAYMVLILHLNPFHFVCSFQVSICFWVFMDHFKLYGMEGLTAVSRGKAV